MWWPSHSSELVVQPVQAQPPSRAFIPSSCAVLNNRFRLPKRMGSPVSFWTVVEVSPVQIDLATAEAGTGVSTPSAVAAPSLFFTSSSLATIVTTVMQVPDDIEFAAILSNPPIRVGKEVLHGLLDTWLPRLAPGAEAHLVVAKHLGADSLQKWVAERFQGSHEVSRIANHKGFRVIQVEATSQ